MPSPAIGVHIHYLLESPEQPREGGAHYPRIIGEGGQDSEQRSHVVTELESRSVGPHIGGFLS